MKKIFILLLEIYLISPLFSQQVFYQNILRGGTTGNGGTTNGLSGVIHFKVKIPLGSFIKKAFLISAEDGTANDYTVTLNGINYTFKNSNKVTCCFVAYNEPGDYLPNSSIHILDITSDINPNVINYNLFLPVQNRINGYYDFFYLYIVFQNPLLTYTNTILFLNYLNVSPNSYYHLFDINPTNNYYPNGLEIMTSYIGDTSYYQDGSYIKVNGSEIGLIGGNDSTCRNWYGAGPYPNYAYYNDSLLGLADDTPDSLVSGSDATANIQSYINNNDSSLTIQFKYQSNWAPFSNPIRGVILNYVTTCDTFSTSVSQDTAICVGDSVQLHTSGGIKYKWQPAYGLSCDTCANPIASPDSSVTYTVRIYHNDSCSKVLPVRVLVYKTHPQISVTPASCGDSNGTVTLTASNVAQYYLGNAHNASGIFNNFPSGAYPAHITDSLGCIVWQDTVHIGITNNAYADFLLNPFIGQAPLTAYTTNLSNHTNVYLWIVNGDTLHSNTITYTFDSAGNYTVTLIACHNSRPCCDTLTQHVQVDSALKDSSAKAFVPNVFTPNGDGVNDQFIIKMKNVKSGSMQIYNRWGTAMEQTSMQQATNGNLTLNWNGKTSQGKACSAGAYYYVVSYVTPSGDRKTVKGNVTLLR